MRSCDVYYRTKSAKYKPYKKLRSPTIPDRFWALIALDFVVKLLLFKKPITKIEFDFIFTIVDRLTKKIRLVFFKKKSSAKKLAYTFLKNVVALNEMPKKIITDKKFTLVFKF